MSTKIYIMPSEIKMHSMPKECVDVYVNANSVKLASMPLDLINIFVNSNPIKVYSYEEICKICQFFSPNTNKFGSDRQTFGCV